MFFNLFRPKPKFSVGQHVIIGRDMRDLKAAKNVLYLRIEKVEWANPQSKKRQWGYGGPTYTKDGPTIFSKSYVRGALESTLSLVNPQP